MELHTSARLKAESGASLVCARYLDRLPLSTAHRRELLARALQNSDLPQTTMRNLHHALAGDGAASDNPAYASVAGRLRASHAQPTGSPHLQISAENGSQIQIATAPPLNRTSMVPQPWGVLNPLRRWYQHVFGKPNDVRAGNHADIANQGDRWQTHGNMRRVVLLLLMLTQTALATYFMSGVLPYHGTQPLEMATLGLFAILLCWVSAGFWTAMVGFMVLLRGGDRYMISRTAAAAETPIDLQARTAIVMPICNEDVARVFAGLRATYESLARNNPDQLGLFDFFILSDSNETDICSAEINAWNRLCRTVDGFGRIFYRRRQRRVKRKSGNIDDFCRRWGKNYRYMVVLDADSVMSGACLTTLVRLMEANPGAGIIQTAPRAAGRDTLYARIQQFSTRVYGPLFVAGLHYWQLGESHYWGHNAIIRLEPFIQHCALAPLPGNGALSGPILSHDFVEAALMRRAGWAVWIAYDLDGSYEEMPPNLLDELQRDRRWCHGNLMNFRLFTARNMHSVHRAVFVTGVMAYLSAPLWFLFLLLSTAMLASHTLIEPQYFTSPRQLFPIWPEWNPERAMALFSATATLLFLPKILSVTLICVKGARDFGGRMRLITGMLIELIFSSLLAPVRMLFHTRFVVGALLGWSIRWQSPPRNDAQTTWGEALRRHGWHTLLGLIWGGAVFALSPSFLWWLLPIVGALVVSIPLSVFSSRVSLGRALRRVGLFMIPEETRMPQELAATAAYTGNSEALPDFIDAVIDPVANALLCACGKTRFSLPETARARLVKTALENGPQALSQQQKNILLGDPLLLSRLHFEVWSSSRAHAQWRDSITATCPIKSELIYFPLHLSGQRQRSARTLDIQPG